MSENIVKGPHVEQLLAKFTVGELTLNTLKSQDNKVAQIDGKTKEELRTNLIINRAIKISKWFDSVGLKIGDSISVCNENRLEFVSIAVAAFFNGIIFAPVNPDYTSRELQHCTDLSKPKIIFCSSLTLDKVLQLQKSTKYIKFIVTFDKINNKFIVYHGDITKGATDGTIDDSFSCKKFDPKDTVATILCSSGTTGLPKGVQCTHYNMTSWIDFSRGSMTSKEYSELVSIGVVPFFHAMGFMTMFWFLLRGIKLIVLHKFNPELFLESIQRYKVTDINVPPPTVLFLNKHPLVAKYDLSSVQRISCGAAPLSRELQLETSQRFKTKNISQSYGLTEATLGLLLNPVGKIKVGSVGCVMPGMQAKVIDESGTALGPRKEGELCFKGSLIMKGYVGDPESTHTIIDKEGWLHTGDVGYYDEDGYFFIVDRIKELIKYKGYQVAPAELEALLLSHPAVADAAVVGLASGEVGELPVAFVEKRNNSKVTTEELKKFVADKVTNYKQLRGGVYFIDKIPRNPSGKILRRLLKDKLKTMRSKL